MSDYLETIRAHREALRLERENREHKIWQTFEPEKLARICAMHETEFAAYLDVQPTLVTGKYRNKGDFYLYQDNGSDILAVAHLDTCMPHERRGATFAYTEAGPVVFSGALDDRLGAYIILEWLPAMGIQFDILLTVGEEDGMSTAEEFQPTKNYNWMIEFDRMGVDVVMYQYDDNEMRALVRDAGATPEEGAFSDISYLGHLEVKGFNWGVGYHNYHGPRSHAFIADTVESLGYFLRFHEANKDEYLPHEELPRGRGGSLSWLDDAEARDEEHRLTYGCDHWQGQCFEDDDDDEDVIDHPTSEQMNAALAILDAEERELTS